MPRVTEHYPNGTTLSIWWDAPYFNKLCIGGKYTGHISSRYSESEMEVVEISADKTEIWLEETK